MDDATVHDGYEAQAERSLLNDRYDYRLTDQAERDHQLYLAAKVSQAST